MRKLWMKTTMTDTTAQMLAMKYNGNVSQYGWVVNGKVHTCSYHGCHSQVLAWKSHGKDVSQAFSFGPNIPDIRLQYIFDPSVSPWRALLPSLGVTLEQVKAGSPFIYNDLSFDANLLVNHMVSVRWPAEQINSYTIWEKLLLNGVHPAVADLLTGLVRARDCQKHGKFDIDKPQFTTYQYMHSNFIALDCTMEYAENFVNGNLAGGNGFPFNEPAQVVGNDYKGGSTPRGYKPIVGAFGKFTQTSYLDQMKGVHGEYVQFLINTYGEPECFANLVGIGLAEQKRFNLDDWPAGQQFAERGIHETPNGVELRPDAISAYERARQGRSHWGYVQTERGASAHAF